jgi:hypothetical protein
MGQIQTYNAPQTKTQTFTLATNWTTNLLPSGSYQFYLSYSTQGGNNFSVILDPTGDPKSSLTLKKVNQGADGRVMEIPQNMPFGTSGIKLIDFVTAIQKKFNLVIYPNKTKLNDFIVEPFNQWYKQGVIRDFNKYINLNENIEVIPANNFAVQNLNFGDTLDGDYISQQFSKSANREFGKAYYVDTTNFFSQGDYTVKTTLASSPLVYLASTGVSGSSTGGDIIAFPVNGDGLVQLSTYGNLYDICNQMLSPTRIVYSTTGDIAPSAVLYFDPYGNSKVVGYNWVVDPQSSGCEIWTLDPITGIVGTFSGDRCIDFGGCY